MDPVNGKRVLIRWRGNKSGIVRWITVQRGPACMTVCIRDGIRGAVRDGTMTLRPTIPAIDFYSTLLLGTNLSRVRLVWR